MGLFVAAHGWREAKILPSPSRPIICHTYLTMIKLGTVIRYLKKDLKIYINPVTLSSSSSDISIYFAGNCQLLPYQEMQI